VAENEKEKVMLDSENMLIPVMVKVINSDGTKIDIPVTKDYEYDIYLINNGKTLVFIDEQLKALLSDKSKSMLGMPDNDDDDLTPEEILDKDIMYIVTDDTFDKEEFIMMAEAIAGRVVNYVTIDDLILNLK